METPDVILVHYNLLLKFYISEMWKEMVTKRCKHMCPPLADSVDQTEKAQHICDSKANLIFELPLSSPP